MGEVHARQVRQVHTENPPRTGYYWKWQAQCMGSDGASSQDFIALKCVCTESLGSLKTTFLSFDTVF